MKKTKKKKLKLVYANAYIAKTKFFTMDFQKSVGKIAKNFVEFEYDAKNQILECGFNTESDACNFQHNMIQWSK